MSGSARHSPVVAVVALKRLARAKTRFRGIPAPLRAELAWCMALDTLSAVRAAVDRVVLVSDEPTARTGLKTARLDVAVITEPPAGQAGEPLNLALSAGLAETTGAALALAVLADLPALRPASVRRIVDAAGRSGQPLIVPDADAIGTTMLVGRPEALVPRFGGASADRHRAFGSNLVPGLESLDDARADVDDRAGLAAAARVGLGRWTRELIARRPDLLGPSQHPARTCDGPGG